jgi:hypothetical protein
MATRTTQHRLHHSRQNSLDKWFKVLRTIHGMGLLLENCTNGGTQLQDAKLYRTQEQKIREIKKSY